MITNLITVIKNAQAARKESVKLPYSNFDFSVAEILAKSGFVDSVSKKGRMPKRIIEVKLKYDAEGHGAITGTRILSKSSRRLYSGYKELRPVRQGFGVSILSTSKGTMTSKEARAHKVGGQLLLEVW